MNPNLTLRCRSNSNPVLNIAWILIFLIASSFLFGIVLPTAQAEQERETIALFMGDVVLDGVMGDLIQARGFDYPFAGMKPMLDTSDITFANLETPISDQGEPEEDKYCTFRSSPGTLNSLTYAGIDAVSLANNHCLDYGYDAMNDTMYYLDRVNIAHAGIWYADMIENASIPRPAIVRRNGLDFGFLSYTEDVRGHWNADSQSAGPMPTSPSLMERDIKYSRDIVDVLVVSIHWRKWEDNVPGHQYTTAPMDEDRELCRNAIDWGADIIMGHGPHVVHEIEGYNDGLILYSLGNAVMNNNYEVTYNSYLARVSLMGSDISEVTLIPTQKEAYRYVPKGTPLTEEVSDGMNITRDDILGMYSNNIYTNDHEDDFEKNAWYIFRMSDPIYYKALSLLVFLVSVAVIIFILYRVLLNKGRSIMDMIED